MDIIADSLTKIRNASLRGLQTVSLRKTRMIQNVLDILKSEGYIDSYKSGAVPYTLEVVLKYLDGSSVIDGLKKISLSSRRVYVAKNAIPTVYNNYGLAILSTSQGVITGREARRLGIGGEVLCYVW